MKAFLLALATAVIWGIVPILEKLGLSRIAPFAGVLIRTCGVIIGAGILAIFRNDAFNAALKVEPKTLFFLVLAGLMASIVGQMFFYNALKVGEASKVVPIAGTYPLVSFLIALLFLGESFTIAKGAGVIFVVLGLFLLR